jgi:hypothetical protein
MLLHAKIGGDLTYFPAENEMRSRTPGLQMNWWRATAVLLVSREQILDKGIITSWDDV